MHIQYKILQPVHDINTNIDVVDLTKYFSQMDKKNIKINGEYVIEQYRIKIINLLEKNKHNLNFTNLFH